jgi:hypothetical protein
MPGSCGEILPWKFSSGPICFRWRDFNEPLIFFGRLWSDSNSRGIIRKFLVDKVQY